MARASRWSPARRKDDGVRTRGARPRLGKPKSAAYSPKPNKTTRDIPCGTKTPRPTWAPLRPPRPSVGGSMRRRCVAVCDRPPGWWCWEMVDLGSDRKSTRLNSSHVSISYAVFCLKKKTDFFNGIRHAMELAEAFHREFRAVTYDVTIKIEHLLKYEKQLLALRDTCCLYVASAVES